MTAFAWIFSIYAFVGAGHAAFALYMLERHHAKLRTHPPTCACCGEAVEVRFPWWKKYPKGFAIALLWPLSMAYGMGYARGRAAAGLPIAWKNFW